MKSEPAIAAYKLCCCHTLFHSAAAFAALPGLRTLPICLNMYGTCDFNAMTDGAASPTLCHHVNAPYPGPKVSAVAAHTRVPKLVACPTLRTMFPSGCKAAIGLLSIRLMSL